MDNCRVGCALQASCHKKTYPSQKQALHLLKSLNDDEQEIVKLRVEAECNTGMEVSLTTICTFHKPNFLDNYSGSYKTCSNIFQVHKKPIRNLSLRVISFNWYKQVKSSKSTLKIVPGRKLCCNCRKKAENMLIKDPQSSSGSELEEIHSYIDADSSISSLNENLQVLGEFPIKFHAVASGRKTEYGK